MQMTQAHSFDGNGKAEGLAKSNGDARPDVSGFGQIVMVLQGGGALGAYQAGVYQALHEAGIEPDWVIGSRNFGAGSDIILRLKPPPACRELAASARIG
jgi:hypothetical protein